MKESLAARQVAEDVLGNIGRGIKPNITKLAIKRGYSPKTADKGEVQKTKSYQRVIQPFVARMQKERNRIIKAMENKDLDNEEYQTLSRSLNSFTHDIQLLSGGSTENVAVAGVEISFRE